jgi:hypothetical protein
MSRLNIEKINIDIENFEEVSQGPGRNTPSRTWQGLLAGV